MAIHDPERGAIAVRIAYDGTQKAKSATLQALARRIGHPSFPGAVTRGGKRSLDWVDFVEGRFEGSTIRCQLVALGAPAEIETRRRQLEAADAVVLVVDSTARALALTRRALASVEEVVAGQSPPVGVVLQVEKGDALNRPASVPLTAVDELAAALGGAAVTEARTSTGEGVLETFTLAVRLALDRIRELERTGALPPGPPSSSGGEELLALLRHAESRSDRPGSTRGELLPERRDRAGDASLAPTLPRADVAAGNVWPPVEGRIVLHVAERVRPALERSRRGDWTAEEGHWRWHSALSDLYDDQAEGREALLDWAHHHAAIAWLLSPRRALALAPAAPGAFRLWQVGLVPPSLEDRLREALGRGDARALASRLVAASAGLVAADREMVAPGHFHRVALSSLAVVDGRVVYSGLLSPQSAPPPGPRPPADAEALLRHELEPLLAETGARERPDLARVLDWLEAAGTASGPAAQSETLIAILSGR